MHAIYELKEKLCDELEEYGEKKLDAGSLDVIDKLAHTIKNLDKIIECYEDGGYSKDGMMYDGSYARGGRGNRGGGGRRGGANQYGSYAMGRYSRDNMSMVADLREMMEEAPDERTKMEFKKFIQKMEQM
jgi:hypothetical protein